MCRAIDFNNQSGFVTVEVRDVGPDGCLSSELVACDLPASQHDPERTLRWGHPFPERSGIRSCCGVRDLCVAIGFFISHICIVAEDPLRRSAVGGSWALGGGERGPPVADRHLSAESKETPSASLCSAPPPSGRGRILGTWGRGKRPPPLLIATSRRNHKRPPPPRFARHLPRSAGGGSSTHGGGEIALSCSVFCPF